MPIRHISELNPYDKNRMIPFAGSEDVEDRSADKNRPKHPAAGPHDKPHLTDKKNTPGAGTLPKPGKADPNDMAPTG